MTNSRQQQQQQPQQQPEPRIIDRRYGSSLALPPRESSSHSRSGSHSSSSSMDVDEMIIKASTADEVAAANNGGAGYPPQYQHLQHLGVQPSGSSSISSPHRRARGLERDRERGDGSPRLNTSPPVPTSNNPYPPSYPASQSAPASGSMRSVAGGSSGSQVLLTTHVFAPVVTGAPTKKTKFPNTPGVGEFLTLLLCFILVRDIFWTWPCYILPSFLPQFVFPFFPFEFFLFREFPLSHFLLVLPFFRTSRFSLFFSAIWLIRPPSFTILRWAVVGDRLTVRGDIWSLRLTFLFLNNQVTRG